MEPFENTQNPSSDTYSSDINGPGASSPTQKTPGDFFSNLRSSVSSFTNKPQNTTAAAPSTQPQSLTPPTPPSPSTIDQSWDSQPISPAPTEPPVQNNVSIPNGSDFLSNVNNAVSSFESQTPPVQSDSSPQVQALNSIPFTDSAKNLLTKNTNVTVNDQLGSGQPISARTLTPPIRPINNPNYTAQIQIGKDSYPSDISHEYFNSLFMRSSIDPSSFNASWEEAKKTNPEMQSIDDRLNDSNNVAAYQNKTGENIKTDPYSLATERFAFMGSLWGNDGLSSLPSQLQNYYSPYIGEKNTPPGWDSIGNAVTSFTGKNSTPSIPTGGDFVMPNKSNFSASTQSNAFNTGVNNFANKYNTFSNRLGQLGGEMDIGALQATGGIVGGLSSIGNWLLSPLDRAIDRATNTTYTPNANAGDAITSFANQLDKQFSPKDKDYLDKVFSGLGTAIPYIAGGEFLKAAEIPSLISSFGIGGLQALSTARDDYQQMVDSGDKDASAKAAGVFAVDLALNTVAHFLGPFSQGGDSGIMSSVGRFLKSTALETANYGFGQTVVNNVATGQPPMKGVWDSVITMAPMSAAFGLMGEATNRDQIKQQENDQRQVEGVVRTVAQQGGTQQDAANIISTLSGQAVDVTNTYIESLKQKYSDLKAHFDAIPGQQGGYIKNPLSGLDGFEGAEPDQVPSKKPTFDGTETPQEVLAKSEAYAAQQHTPTSPIPPTQDAATSEQSKIGNIPPSDNTPPNGGAVESVPRSDIISTDPIINLKKEVPVTDIYGNKSVIPSGEALTPYQLKGNKILLKDGVETILSKNQYQNIRNQSISAQGKEFAPELNQTEETLKSNEPLTLDEKTQLKQIIKDNGDLGYDTTSEAIRDLKPGDVNSYDWNNPSDSSKVKELLSKRAPTKYSSYQLPEGNNYKEILVRSPQGSLPDFKSSHWDEPNVISHIRMNEHTYNGKKVAFMEELQSDWAREGREKGFRNPDLIDQIRKYPVPQDENEWSINTLVNAGVPKEIVSEYYETSMIGVPNNPLVKNWTELSVKRALQEAVNSGSDYFSWINGDQTSARYNLSTQVDSVKWGADIGEGKKEIVIRGQDGKEFYVNLDKDTGNIINGVGMPGEWRGKKIDEVIGKGLSDKIMASDKGNLSGEGLKFGGEWANNLYDKQVPNIVKDLTGQKPEIIDMGLPIDNKTPSFDLFTDKNLSSRKKLTPDNIKVNNIIIDKKGDYYEISDVLGDGKFKAIPRKWLLSFQESLGDKTKGWSKDAAKESLESAKQTFDISQKNSPGQQAIKITPEVKAIVEGKAPQLKQPSGITPVAPPSKTFPHLRFDSSGRPLAYTDRQKSILDSARNNPIGQDNTPQPDDNTPKSSVNEPDKPYVSPNFIPDQGIPFLNRNDAPDLSIQGDRVFKTDKNGKTVEILSKQRVADAIAKQVQYQNTIESMGKTVATIFHSTGITNVEDKILRDKYQAGVPIEEIATQSSNPKGVLKYLTAVKNYYAKRITIDKATGSLTYEEPNHLTQFWDVSDAKAKEALADIATQQEGRKNYTGYAEQSKIFPTYAEGENATYIDKNGDKQNFRPKNGNMAEDILEDSEKAAKKISGDILKKGLIEAAPSNEVSTVGEKIKNGKRLYSNNNINGISGMTVSSALNNMLNGFQDESKSKIVEQTGNNNDENKGKNVLNIARKMTEEEGKTGAWNVIKNVPKSSKEAGFWGNMATIYDGANDEAKKVIYNLSLFHIQNIGIKFGGWAMLTDPMKGFDGIARSTAAFLSDGNTQDQLNHYDSTFYQTSKGKTSVLEGALAFGQNFEVGKPLEGWDRLDPLKQSTQATFPRFLLTLRLAMTEVAMKSGIDPYTPEGKEVGKEMDLLMGTINTRTMAISPARLRMVRRFMATPDFTLSKWMMLADAATKWGTATHGLSLDSAKDIITGNKRGNFARKAVVGDQLLTNLVGVIGTTIMTGQFPGLMKLFGLGQPAIGTKLTKQGVPQDMTLPTTYLGETKKLNPWSGGFDPWGYGFNRVSPALRLVVEALPPHANSPLGRNWYGKPIINKASSTPAILQFINNAVIAANSPIGVQNYLDSQGIDPGKNPALTRVITALASVSGQSFGKRPVPKSNISGLPGVPSNAMPSLSGYSNAMPSLSDQNAMPALPSNVMPPLQ